MKFATVLAGALLLLGAAAQAQTCTLLSPVNVTVGGTVHVTPRDQACAPIPIGQCEIPALQTGGSAAGFAGYTKDATGFVIAGVATNGVGSNVKISCGDGVNPAVLSPNWTLKVNPAPYPVTAIYSSSP